MPRALHGDEWSMLVWGCEPPSLEGFFFRRSPDLWSGFFTFGRGSSLNIRELIPVYEMRLWIAKNQAFCSKFRKSPINKRYIESITTLTKVKIS
jgi:hypothetical protein